MSPELDPTGTGRHSPAAIALRQQIAHRAEAQRTLRGMSIQGLARATDLSPLVVWRVEQAVHDHQIGTLYAVATALGLDLLDLLDAGSPETPGAPAPVSRDTNGQRIRPSDYPAVLQMRSNIARTITSIRESRGMSMGQLGRDSGLGAPAIWRLENTKNDPQIGTLHAVAAALDIPLDHLIKGQPE